MATTGSPANIPLFDDDSAMTPIQAPFNAIATALNNYLKVIDSGWVDLTPASGWTAASGLGYRRIGNLLYLRGQVTQTSGNISSANGVVFLPSAVRPKVLTTFVGVGAGTTMAKVVAQTTGSVDIAGVTANTNYVRFDGATIPLN